MADTLSDADLKKILESLPTKPYGVQLLFPTESDKEYCKRRIGALRQKIRDKLIPFTVRQAPQDKLALWLIPVTEKFEGEWDEKVRQTDEKSDD